MKYKIDIARLYETWPTLRADMCGSLRLKRVISQLKIADWQNISRTTLISIVSAIGDAGPPLFGFKRKQIPYRNRIVNGIIVQEAYASYLPRSAVITMK